MNPDLAHLERIRDDYLAYKAGDLPNPPTFTGEAVIEMVQALLDTSYRLARLEEALLSFLKLRYGTDYDIFGD